MLKARITAILFALALLLIPLSALGADEEGFEDQYRIGTDDQIFVDPIDVDPCEQMRLNGYYYRPNMSTVQKVMVQTGDLVTAVRLAAAADALPQQGIDVDDLFIRNGKVFLDAGSNPDLSAAECAQQLANVRTFLNKTNITAKDLAGKEFTLTDGAGHARSFLIQSVWQSPLDPPGYDPFSKAIPAPMPKPQDVGPSDPLAPSTGAEG